MFYTQKIPQNQNDALENFETFGNSNLFEILKLLVSPILLQIISLTEM